MSHERNEYSFDGPDMFVEKPNAVHPGVLLDGRVFVLCADVYSGVYDTDK